MNAQAVLHSLGYFGPEVALTVTLLLAIIADIVFKRVKAVAGGVAFLGTAAALVMVVMMWRSMPDDAGVELLFAKAVAFDHFSLFFKALFLVATLLVILFAWPVVAKWPTGRGEVYALILSCTLGMCFMVAATDLLMMYLSLEFVSITSYILAGFLRKNRKSIEASMKYILYGAAASGLMIYGMSFLYGVTGTLDIGEIGRRLSTMNPPVPMTMSLVVSTLIMAGFGYKIAAAPFHMWCPDVYEGAPTPVTAFFSVGPKAAGLAMLARFLAGAYGGVQPADFDWRIILALLAVLTLVVGNFGALLQTNLKRLLAYSSIGHAGIMLLAFNVFDRQSIEAVSFYLAAYLIMNLGAFVVVIVLEEQFGIETIDQCRGLGWRAPGICAVTVVFLLSLTGLPPTAGFVGKLLVFQNLVTSGWPQWMEASRASTHFVMPPVSVALAVVGVLFSVVSLFYYARIIAAMYLAKPAETGPYLRTHPVGTALAWILAGATLFFGVFPQVLSQFAERAGTLLPK